MNQSLILKIVGVILCIEALCMAPSLLLSIACGGVDQCAFLYALLICGGVGVLLSLIRARNHPFADTRRLCLRGAVLDRAERVRRAAVLSQRQLRICRRHF